MDRALWKLFKRKRQSPTVNNCPFEQDFNMTELDTAVKKLACRKAPGPDNIKNEMIKNLEPKGKTTLLNFINKT